MTKQEFLAKNPTAYAFQNYFGLWNIWAGDGEEKIWKGKGETQESAWEMACEDDVF